MKKIVITQEQADAIKKMGALSNHRKGKFVEEHVLKNWNDGQRGLQGLTTNELIRALYIGYEVEPEFKIGQWVKSRHGKGIGKIVKISKQGYHTDFNMIADADDIRHATPQEIATEKTRRWWAKHNREPFELVKGDVIKGIGFSSLRWRIGEYKGIFEDSGKTYYQIENISDGTAWDIEPNSLKVICFVDQRKDI